MNYKLAIFDMDGTILNTIEDLADSCNFILSKYNYPVHTYDQIRFMVGNGLAKLIERALPAGTSELRQKELLAEFIPYYQEHCAIKTCAYPGIVDLIKQLKKAGVKIAVNTNKVETAAVELCDRYFPGLFDIISGSRPGMPPKPAPDGIYEILIKAGMTREAAKQQAVFIGDSDVDLQTGMNAGLNVIGCDWGFRGKAFLLEHGAENIAMVPADIIRYF